MSDDGDLAHLDEMVQALIKIERYTGGASRTSFLADSQVRDAVALNLLVLGECAGRLSESAQNAAPDVLWPALRSLRNRIAHGYRSIDHTIVWAIVQDRLPELRARLAELLEQLESRS